MAEATSRPRKTTIRVQGISIKVDPNAFDDEDYLEAAEDAQMALMEVDRLKAAGEDTKAAEDKAAILATLVNRRARDLMFGDQWATIKEKLRGEDGKLTASTCVEFLHEAQAQVRALKN